VGVNGVGRGGQKGSERWREQQQQQLWQLQCSSYNGGGAPTPCFSFSEYKQQLSHCIPSSPPPLFFLHTIL